MQRNATTVFESALTGNLKNRDGAAVAAQLPDDPLNRWGRAFNRHMIEVGDDAIDIAYLLPLVVLAAKIEDGEIGDIDTLFKVSWGIQKRVGRKLAGKAERKAHPQVRARRQRGDVGPPSTSRALFAPAGSAMELYPGREPDPSFALQRRELFPLLLAGARGMGRLPLRVFREVRLFGVRHGTQFGAFTEVAKSAVLDDAGKVVAVRPHDPNGSAGEPPTAAVVRQITRHYRTATEYLIRQGVWSGRSEL